MRPAIVLLPASACYNEVCEGVTPLHCCECSTAVDAASFPATVQHHSETVTFPGYFVAQIATFQLVPLEHTRKSDQFTKSCRSVGHTSSFSAGLGRNHNNQACSFPTDWRLSAIMCLKLRNEDTPWNAWNITADVIEGFDWRVRGWNLIGFLLCASFLCFIQPPAPAIRLLKTYQQHTKISD